MNRRLAIWLSILAALLVVRWWDPLPKPDADEPISVVAPSQRQVKPSTTKLSEAIPPMPPSLSAPQQASSAPEGNAFQVRGAPPIVAMQAAPKKRPTRQLPPPVALAPVAPAEPPAPQPVPPPLQVIGTWSDGMNTPGVFVSAPSGTLLARVGETLMAEFKVDQINQRELVLKQLSNQQIWRLSIPQVVDHLGTGAR